MFIPSHLQAISRTIGSHFSSLPTLLFGPPAGGKSILLTQLAYDFLKNNRNALLIDTEGGLRQLIELWRPIFDKRFDISTTCRVLDGSNLPRKEKNCIYVLETRSLKKLLQLHGFNTELLITEGNRIDVRLKKITENYIQKVIDKVDAGYLIYDSIIRPLKSTFVGGRLNFPGRADALSMWLGAIQAIADDHNITIYANNHYSVDPANPWAKPHSIGGSEMRYNFKISLYLEASRSGKTPNLRYLHLERFFNSAPWSKKVTLELTDTGYYDKD